MTLPLLLRVYFGTGPYTGGVHRVHMHPPNETQGALHPLLVHLPGTSIITICILNHYRVLKCILYMFVLLSLHQKGLKCLIFWGLRPLDPHRDTAPGPTGGWLL